MKGHIGEPELLQQKAVLMKTQVYLKAIRNEIEIAGDSFPAGMTHDCVVIYLAAQTLTAQMEHLEDDELNAG